VGKNSFWSSPPTELSELTCAPTTRQHPEHAGGPLARDLHVAETGTVESEAAQAAIKALDPPPGIADWHQTQIEWFGLESLFARAVVKNGITVTKPAYDAAKERFMAEANDELVRAVETCPQLATFHARVVVGETPAASPEA
jgi:hypothetical protein